MTEDSLGGRYSSNAASATFGRSDSPSFISTITRDLNMSMTIDETIADGVAWTIGTFQSSKMLTLLPVGKQREMLRQVILPYLSSIE